MNERLRLIRLPILLLVLFFLGKLIVGAAGGSYEASNRAFAMVPLTVHLCIVWGALSCAFYGSRAGGAALTGASIALVAQLLIILGTAGSYLLGAETAFNNPIALVGAERAVGFGEAMGLRAFGLVVNCVIAAVVALIGWALGRLIPAPASE